jgi:hypothetical protein
MIGSGNEKTIEGKKNQVMGGLFFVVGLVWWLSGVVGGRSLGPWLTLFGVALWVLGRFKEWLGR